MTVVSTIKMTARQFLELGEDPPGVRLELVNGEVAVSPSPTPAHSYTIIQLTILLGSYIKRHGLGELYGDVDTIFGEHDVRRPDLLFFAKGRLHLISEKAMEGAPDLCIEVLSPSSGTIDRRDKFEQYAQGGVQDYWIVDPRQLSVEGFTLDRGVYSPSGVGRENDVIRLPPFPGLEIPLLELWKPCS
jgi:Uma2 family endonuclease